MGPLIEMKNKELKNDCYDKVDDVYTLTKNTNDLVRDNTDMMADKFDKLIDTLKVDVCQQLKSLDSQVENLCGQNQNYLRWLLAVVCIIALGSKLLELVVKFWPTPH